MTSNPQAFWLSKSLADLSGEEWEALCDGCGKCCLHKIEDEDTGEVHYTAVACRLLDLGTIRCRRYPERRDFVPDCTVITPDTVANYGWLPDTCAYRLVARGEDLPDWHQLKTGDRETMHGGGHSIRGRVVAESEAGPLEDHVDPDLR